MSHVHATIHHRLWTAGTATSTANTTTQGRSWLHEHGSSPRTINPPRPLSRDLMQRSRPALRVCMHVRAAVCCSRPNPVNTAQRNADHPPSGTFLSLACPSGLGRDGRRVRGLADLATNQASAHGQSSQSCPHPPPAASGRPLAPAAEPVSVPVPVPARPLARRPRVRRCHGRGERGHRADARPAALAVQVRRRQSAWQASEGQGRAGLSLQGCGHGPRIAHRGFSSCGGRVLPVATCCICPRLQGHRLGHGSELHARDGGRTGCED